VTGAVTYSKHPKDRWSGVERGSVTGLSEDHGQRPSEDYWPGASDDLWQGHHVTEKEHQRVTERGIRGSVTGGIRLLYKQKHQRITVGHHRITDRRQQRIKLQRYGDFPSNIFFYIRISWIPHHDIFFFHTPPITTYIFGYLKYNICLIYSMCFEDQIWVHFSVDLQTSNFDMWLYL
jgi:hypothetical protein